MTSALGQYLFYKPATYKTSMIRITTKYRPIYKILGIVYNLKVNILGYSVTASGLAGPAGALGRELWLAWLGAKGKLNFSDFNSSLFMYVDYDDNVTLAVLVCVFADLIYSFSTRVDYL